MEEECLIGFYIFLKFFEKKLLCSYYQSKVCLLWKI